MKIEALAKRRMNAVVAGHLLFAFLEVFTAPFGLDLLEAIFVVDGFGCEIQDSRRDVAALDIPVGFGFVAFEVFCERDCDGVGFFASGTSAAPRFERLGVAELSIDELRENGFVEVVEVIYLAEKEGVIGRNRVDQVVEFAGLRVVPQHATIVVQGVHPE